VLTDQGPRPRTGTGGCVLLLACGALAREILALKAANGWDHLDLHCLPANLHLWPDRIPDAVEAAVARFRDRYAEIFVVYADCGTGGLLQARCAELGVEMVEGPALLCLLRGARHLCRPCRDRDHGFYLTDFLVRQFDAFVWKPMGFDRHPELIPMMFGNYEKLVYLAQTDDPALTPAREAARQRLGLAYERRLTGYGDLARR
jgi:hypothetical protein